MVGFTFQLKTRYEMIDSSDGLTISVDLRGAVVLPERLTCNETRSEREK